MSYLRAFVPTIILFCFISYKYALSYENLSSKWISDNSDLSANSLTLSELDKILDSFNYHDVEEALRNLDRSDPKALILAETIIIFHSIRMNGSVDYYMKSMGQKVQAWQLLEKNSPSHLDKIFKPMAKYYMYHSTDNNKEEKYDRLTSLITSEPENYLDAWVQCYVSVDTQVSSFDLLNEYQRSFLDSQCPKKYGLAHMPIAGQALLSVFQGFTIEMNNKIAQELYKKGLESTDLYARIDCYAALLGFGMNARQTDMVLTVRELGESLKNDLQAQGFVSETFLYFELFADVALFDTFPDIISSQEVLAKYENIVSRHSSVSDFIDKFELDQHAVLLAFLQSMNHVHTKIYGKSLELKWNEFVEADERSWEEVGEWILAARLLSLFQQYELDDPITALVTLDQMILIHDAHYRDRLSRFDFSNIKNEMTRSIAEELNMNIGAINGDSEVHAMIYEVHAQLGEELLYLEKPVEALEQLELAWARLPEQYKFEAPKTADLLVNISMVYSDLGDNSGAANYASLVLDTWTNIFQKNNNYIFIQEFENDQNARFGIVMAMYSFLNLQNEQEWGSREFRRLEDLMFKCIQILRMNRVTFTNKINDKGQKIKEINALARVNRGFEENAQTNVLVNIFDDKNAYINKDFELANSGDLIWNVPTDTLILIGYDTGRYLNFAAMGAGYMDPVFAGIKHEDINPKIESIMESMKLTDDLKLREFDYENATWVYNEIFGNRTYMDWSEIKNLVILPSNSTFNFPFAVLSREKIKESDPNNTAAIEFLIDKFNLSYFIDFDDNLRNSVLDRFIVEEAQDTPVTAQTFLGLGNPNFGAIDTAAYRAISIVEPDGELTPDTSFESLPETADEILEVSKFFKGPGSQLLIGPDATKNNLISKDLSQFDVLMFSTHGINQNIDKGYGETALVLGKGNNKDGNLDDILLKPEEIISLNLDADLTILNACNSGLPNTRNAPGLTGIAQSFLTAGSKAIMVANWSIDSKTTVELMKRMFSYLKDSTQTSFNSALIYAQRSLKADEKTSHPFFWAPYSMYGNF